MTFGDRVAQTALSYQGTPFHPQGRLPGVGLDCIGVAVCAYAANGFPVRDDTSYGFPPPREMLQRVLHAHLGDPRPGTDPRTGDICALLWEGGRNVIHGGVFTDKGIVTVEVGTTVRAQSLDYWMSGDRIVACYGVDR